MMSASLRQASSSDLSATPTLSGNHQLFSQQIAQLYSLAPVGIIASLVTSPILMFVLWNVTHHQKLISWLVSMVVINIIWCILVYQYRRVAPPADETSRWGTWFIVGNAASGLVWGAAGFFLYPVASIPHETLLTLVLGGMVAGSTAVHASLFRAFLAYSLPTVLPLIVRLFQEGDELHFAMGMMAILFLMLMGITARRHHLMTVGSITLWLENARLIDEISQARDHLESVVEARTAELQTSESRYRLLAENLTDVIWVMDVDGRYFTYVSPSVEYLRGYTPEEAMSHSLEETLTPASAQKARAAFEEELTLKRSGNADPFRSRTLELEHRCKDGSTVWAEVRSGILFDENGCAVGIVGVTRDVTERKKMEMEKQRLKAQLVRSQKIEAVGTLAGGIAHDFNNFLTSVLGNIALAKDPKTSIQSRAEFLTKAEQVTLRAKGLTQQLLTFAKGGEPIKQLASLDLVIKESSSFALSGSSVACEYVFSPDLWPTDIDPGQITQVVHNLVLNAVQAMPNGGTMTIRAENFLLHAQTLDRKIPLPPGPYLKVSFRDQGCGISEEHMSQIFDPYFSTKSDGHGLGLASAYSIMKKHGGLITVDSKLGVGTEFTLIFPASPNAQVPSTQEIVQQRQGRGKILVMDDDEPIRLVAGELLTRCGYQYELAKDGYEAITQYKKAMKSGQPFSAVILDLTVPGNIGGKETLRRLRSIDPEVKVIVSSGYSNDPIMANYEIHGIQGVIPKPYSMAMLSQVVYRVVMELSSD